MTTATYDYRVGTLEGIEALENEVVSLIHDLARIGDYAIQKGLLTPQELNEIAGLEGLEELEAAEEILAGFIEAFDDYNDPTIAAELQGLEDALEWGFFKNIVRKVRRVARRVGRGVRNVIRRARKIKIRVSPSTFKKAAIGAAVVGGALALPAVAPGVVGAATGVASKIVGSGLFGKVAGWVGRKIAGMWRGGKNIVQRGWNLLRSRMQAQGSPTMQPTTPQPDPGLYNQYPPPQQSGPNWLIPAGLGVLLLLLFKGGKR